MSDVDIMNQIRKWAETLHPCDKPCDSWGICQECIYSRLIVAGARVALDLKNGTFVIKEDGE